MNNDIEKLLTYIQIKPKNLQLYELALTHSSFNADAKTKHHDYERLEYIGDAVLGFIVADLIFGVHPEMDQGLMSKLRSHLVQSKALANYARKINLQNSEKFLFILREWRTRQNLQQITKVGDAVECNPCHSVV